MLSFSGVFIEIATNITLPPLMNEFQVTTSMVQWMTRRNLLMVGILIPISSFLKKRFETKKLFYRLESKNKVNNRSKFNYFGFVTGIITLL